MLTELVLIGILILLRAYKLMSQNEACICNSLSFFVSLLTIQIYSLQIYIINSSINVLGIVIKRCMAKCLIFEHKISLLKLFGTFLSTKMSIDKNKQTRLILIIRTLPQCQKIKDLITLSTHKSNTLTNGTHKLC